MPLTAIIDAIILLAIRVAGYLRDWLPRMPWSAKRGVRKSWGKRPGWPRAIGISIASSANASHKTALEATASWCARRGVRDLLIYESGKPPSAVWDFLEGEGVRRFEAEGVRVEVRQGTSEGPPFLPPSVEERGSARPDYVLLFTGRGRCSPCGFPPHLMAGSEVHEAGDLAGTSFRKLDRHLSSFLSASQRFGR